jgi:transposase
MRQEWWRRVANVDLGRLVFLDETGAKTCMTRAYGRAEGGHRVVDHAPAGHWSTTTLLSSLRQDARSAAMVIEGSTDAEVFRAYIQQVLVPILRVGDIVVMDNLSPHKGPSIEAMIRAAGAEAWYLPPYRRDYNPVEQLRSKVKAFLRKAKARTSQALLTAVGQALRTVTSDDVSGWYAHCGYVTTRA